MLPSAGSVAFDSGTRSAYAADASNYRQVPLGVVFPLDHDDVVAALRVCAEHDAPVLARGAGTSLAGQACNVAVIVDLSRHMTRILELDPVARIARVQPGVVLDDLRRAAEEHGLTFGPDPATHAWCTLGGMIGNNSCGSHALFAGKTVDNVERLTLVTYGGTTLDLGAFDDARGRAARGRGRAARGVLGELPSDRRRPCGRDPRALPGHPAPGQRLQPGPAPPGAGLPRRTGRRRHRVRLRDRHRGDPPSDPRRRAIVAWSSSATRTSSPPPMPSRSHLRHPLLALEGFDIRLIEQMRERPLNVEHLELLPDGRGWLIAELGADDPVDADALTSAFIADLPAGVDWRRYDDPERQARTWLIRESALGATALSADGTHNFEGWEDAAVAPAQLGRYLRALTALWAEYGYSGSLYGHFGQGCAHTRNPFDFSTADGPADLPRLHRAGRRPRRLARRVAVGRARRRPGARRAARADVRPGARRAPSAGSRRSSTRAAG